MGTGAAAMASLHILKGVHEGARVPINGDRFVIGRNPDCCIVIPVTSVSREHAVILRVEGRFFIEDNKSANGTYVNGSAVTSRKPLNNNDRIRICDFLAVFLETAPAQELVEALAAGPGGAERKDVQVVCALDSSLEEECRRIWAILQVNHVFYDRAEANGLHQELTAPQSRAREILGAGFHRLVVLDAERGMHRGGRFDLDGFLRYVHDELVQAFDLHRTVDTYHLENIAQVLKDEPRSLFCFLNLQRVPVADLGRLRGFTQELHQALFLCCGLRDLAQEEGVPDEEADSNMPFDNAAPEDRLLQTQPAEKLRGLLEIYGYLSGTLDLEALLPRIVDSLFGLFRQADRCFLIQTEEGSKRLQPRIVKTRRLQDETNARFSRSIVQRCLETAQAFLSDDASRDDRIQLSQSVVDFRIRSVMCVPLCDADGKAFGVIQLDTQDRSKKFTQEDLKLLWAVAHQAAVALENARMHSETLAGERRRCALAFIQEMQVSLWPRELPRVAGYALFAHQRVAPEVPGSCCRFLPLPGGRLAVALGKVPGKSAAAATLTARVAAELPVFFLTEASPVGALRKLDGLLCEFCARTDLFVPLAAAVLDPGTHALTLVNAGQPTPLLYRAADHTAVEAMPREAAGIPLGFLGDSPLASCEAALGPGDCLLLYNYRACPGDSHTRSFDERDVRAALRDACDGAPEAVSERLAAVVATHPLVLAGLLRFA
jgi:pSer/pThr/pTyr-binding forkhead associated (FHA) protein